jgi:hypothetical protein
MMVKWGGMLSVRIIVALALLVGKCHAQSWCLYEGDGECDVPTYCPEGTDLADCAATGAGASTCQWEGDGECDVPTYCLAGTDLVDCTGISSGGDSNSGSGEYMYIL